MTEPQVKYQVRKADFTEQEIEQKLAHFHRFRETGTQRRKKAWAALSAAAAVLLVLGWWSRSLTPSAENAQGGNGTQSSEAGLSEGTARSEGTVQPSTVLPGEDHRGPSEVSFRDGSIARLGTPTTRLSVLEVSAKNILVDLPTGQGMFRVTPNPERQFVVRARDIVVTVLGTEFTITHEEGRSHVAVVRGKVRVDYQGDAQLLTAGEAAWFGPEPTDAQTPGPVEEGPTGQVSPGAVRPRGDKTDAVAHSPRDQFLEHHKKAEFAQAYAVLTQDRSVVRGANDLLKAADAARYSGHPAEAVQYLKQVAASDPLGPAARFTLGRLYLHELGNPAAAASAFAESRRLAPGGPLAEDALYRETEARFRAGQGTAARGLAEQYVRTYPQSRRREAVERFGGLR